MLSLAEVALRAVSPWPLKAVVDYVAGNADVPRWLSALVLPVGSTPRGQLLATIVLVGLLTQLAHQAVLMLHTRQHVRIGQAMVFGLRVRLSAPPGPVARPSRAHAARRHRLPARGRRDVHRASAPQGRVPGRLLCAHPGRHVRGAGVSRRDPGAHRRVDRARALRGHAPAGAPDARACGPPRQLESRMVERGTRASPPSGW